MAVPLRSEQLRASVVIPTFNRQDLLRLTLESLAGQRLPPDEFEVIVSDDGSTDQTAALAHSFQSRLHLKYCFQEDQGFRAATARNAGARLAAGPVLLFLDTGVVAGPDLLHNHLDLHAAHPAGGRAVLGYTYGYRPKDGSPAGLAEAIRRESPEQVFRRYQQDPALQEFRHDAFTTVGFDLSRRAVPWLLFWTLNVSVNATDFRSVGGFDDDFRGWGVEDLELGYRLSRHRGVEFVGSRECWAFDMPHDRDRSANLASNDRNVLQFLHKHPAPEVELCWALLVQRELWPIEDAYRGVLDWTIKARDLAVVDEIRSGLRDLPSGARVAVFGCGGDVPGWLPPSMLVDFDQRLLADLDGHHDTLHAIGVRTPLPDQSVDLVLITSRLCGLWGQWGAHILREAHRIGAVVQGPP
jgi:glycosyltransferase involved in cell wall biosynthesis